MSKRFRLSALVATIAVAILALVFMTFGASAMSESELSSSITKKVKYANLFRCYDGIHNSAETLNFSSASDLFIGNDDNLIAPEGWSGVSGRCSDLVGGMIGSVPSDQPARGQILQKLGYSGGGTSSRCVWFEYTKHSRTGAGGYSSQVIKTDKVCASVAADGTMSNYQTDGAAGEPYNITSFDGSQLVANYDDKINGGVYETYVQGYNNNWDAFVNAYASTITRLAGQSSFMGVNGTTDTYYERSTCDGPSGSCTEDASAGSGSYSISNRNTAASLAALNYLGLANGNFTTAEKVSLYQFYLRNNSSSIVCNPSDIPDLTVAHKVKLVIDSKYYENCYAIEREPGSTSVHAVDGNFSLTGTINYQGIIDALNSMTATTDREGIIDPGASIGSEMGTPVTPSPTDPTDPSDGGETGDASDVCYGSRGTLGMSWLLCPVMSWMANSLNWFYDNVVEDYVKVDTSITSNDDVYEAWKIFQNAANIVVVLILLVVIFSQLTGIGIDNYGIKKVLPRLIIFAIVVNLSYFIMQLLVDVSNIIGNSIGNIFQVTGTGGSAEAASGVDIPSNILGITVATSAGVGIAAVVANPAILLGLILVLLSGLISVLMMWVILVTRQALILIAIIIAPIAFASYVLPNTRSFGKRWGSLVKDLLILFPEAAFLIGVSFFASKLLADANPAFTFPAILLRVMPFIALPELFRRSINAIDGLGNRLSSYGNNLSRGATGAMRGADWYKNAQERGIERRTRIRAGLNQDGTEATGWRGFLRSRNDRNRARYRSQYLKDQGEQYKADLLNDQGYMDAMRQKQQFEADEAGRDATKYTQAGYIEGKAAQGRLSRENEIEGARLYNTPGFEPSKRSQYEESRQSELRKMFTEQNLSQGTTADQRRDRLSDLLRNGLSGENDAAEAEALIDLLNDKGDIRQLIDGLNGVTTAQLGAMDAGLRSRIAGRAQATGNSLLKGWAKSVNRGNNISIDDYITRTGAGGLNNYITTDAGTSLFDNADKDTLEFLAAHNGARALGTNGAEAALASMATSAANASPRAANAINSMLLASEANNAGAINTIGSHITAENLAKMKRNNIATTFMAHAGSLNNAISTITQPGNEQLLSSMSNDVRATLGI